MKILGYHILSEAELQKRINDARNEQRNLSNKLIGRLLYNAEFYRRQTMGSVALMPKPLRLRRLKK
jgi:hypothetical protein